jgi:pimeloyl-ACP methyl ester carboxylesterase
MANIVVAHGAWSAGWAWKKMRPRLRALGHEIYTPTYTGLGERVHLATPDVDLSTHIQDIVNMLEYEDLQDVVLLGHSYGGMVATGVADRVSERIALVIYLDAFVPRDGTSLTDFVPARQQEQPRQETLSGDGWRIPPMAPSPDTSPEDLAWVTPRRQPQPHKTFEEKIRLTGAVDRLPRTYVYYARAGEGDVFRQFAERAKADPAWRYEELDSTHNAHITAPDALTALLDRLIREA